MENTKVKKEVSDTYLPELVEIQNRLNAPKNQFNKFGNFNYRNAEDILEALKPLLKEYRCYVKTSDKIVFIGTRFYIKAKAMIVNSKGESESATAYAREPEIQKGMNEAQITGSSSSYARKYALNGLFAIDDARDPDNQDNRQEGKGKVTDKKTATKGKGFTGKLDSSKPATLNQMNLIKKLSEQHKFELQDSYGMQEASDLISEYMK